MVGTIATGFGAATAFGTAVFAGAAVTIGGCGAVVGIDAALAAFTNAIGAAAGVMLNQNIGFLQAVVL